MFPWIADTAVIRCIVMLRAGLKSDSDEALARKLLANCLQRGLPIFAEGLPLLQEAASVLRSYGDDGREGSLVQSKLSRPLKPGLVQLLASMGKSAFTEP